MAKTPRLMVYSQLARRPSQTAGVLVTGMRPPDGACLPAGRPGPGPAHACEDLRAAPHFDFDVAHALLSHGTAPTVRGAPAGWLSGCRARDGPTARHQQAQPLLRRLGGLDAHDAPLVHDGDAVGERANPVQLGGNEQDGRPLIASAAELPVDELDRADVDAARRLRRQQHAWIAGHLACDDDVLLIAA